MLQVEVRPAGLLKDLDTADAVPPDRRSCREDSSVVTLTIAARLKRVGMATKLLIEGEANRPRAMPDRSLLRLLAQAHQYPVDDVCGAAARPSPSWRLTPGSAAPTSPASCA